MSNNVKMNRHNLTANALVPVHTKRLATDMLAADAAAVQGLTFANDEAIVTLGSASLPERGPWWKRIAPTTFLALATGAIAVLFLLVEMSQAGKLGFPLDGAWVHLVYARNIFKHIAFEFNLGEHSTGPTAPLWTVFLAFGLPIFHDPIVTAKLFSSIFLFLAGYYTFRLLRSREFDYGSSLLGALIVLTVPRLTWSELSGMEMTLSAAVVIAGLWSYLQPPSVFGRNRGWNNYLTGAIFAIAAIARPESMLVFFIVLLHRTFTFLFRTERDKTHGAGKIFAYEAIRSVSAFVFILAPLAITNYALSGSILPATFFAALQPKSLPNLIWSGDVGGFVLRLATSTAGLWNAVIGIYFLDDPILLGIIVLAFYLRWKHRRLRVDAASQLFTLGALTLLLFPYLRTLFLGTSSALGEEAQTVQFLSVIYIVTGLAGIKLILNALAQRGPSNRLIIVGFSVCALILGVLSIWSRPEIANTLRLSSTPVPENMLLFIGVFLFVFAIGSVVAFRYAAKQSHKLRRYAIDPSEFDKIQYRESSSSKDNAGFTDEPTAPHVIIVMRAILIITLCWHIAELPFTAVRYSASVLKQNEENVASAKALALLSDPNDIIATNAIGAFGWFSGRTIYDTEGLTSLEDLHDPPQDLGIRLIRHRPHYFIHFGASNSESLNALTPPFGSERLHASPGEEDAPNYTTAFDNPDVQAFRLNFAAP
jgi:hypothetical protein